MELAFLENGLFLQWVPLWFAQILRGACILVGPFCIILSGLHFHKTTMGRSQRYRFAALSLLLMSVIYTQAERWNDPATPRLFIATLGVAFAFAGLWKLRKDTYDGRAVS